MKTLIILACVMLSANAFAECAKNARGETVCGNGQSAGGYNQNTGKAWTSQTNQNGVRTTQTNRGARRRRRTAKASFKAQVGPTATGLRTVTDAIDDVSAPIVAFASMTCTCCSRISPQHSNARYPTPP